MAEEDKMQVNNSIRNSLGSEEICTFADILSKSRNRKASEMVEEVCFLWAVFKHFENEVDILTEISKLILNTMCSDERFKRYS